MPSLEITTMVGCPLKCTFCPQDSLRGIYGKAEKYMPLETFRTILAKVPRHVRIDFSGMAEPWANPDATAMIRHTLEDGRPFALYTTLYGLSLSDCGTVVDMLRRHAKQIEVLCLHLPDRRGNMRGWRYSVDYEANLRAFIGLAMERVLPRVEVMTMDQDGQVHADLDHLGIKLGAFVCHTRAGNVAAPEGQKIDLPPRHELPVTCGFTQFYDQNVLLPNGDVVLCCMDYSLDHKVGNLLRQDYYEMFATGLGPVVAENMRPGFSERSLCKSCNRAVMHHQDRGALTWNRVQA
jgi:Iron-sulfur cluster-binding domain